MAKASVAMHSVHEVLPLYRECGRSQREVALSCKISVRGVNGIFRMGGGWPGAAPAAGAGRSGAGGAALRASRWEPEPNHI